MSDLGIKIGLEIHQQLETHRKLFCSCPSIMSDEYKVTLTRKLRPVTSEMGDVDVAALFEWRKGKTYLYHVPDASSCLVECDEEPPHEMDPEAVKIALGMAISLHATPVDEIYVMRKIVIDGSNTSGFQRTAIVSLGGFIEDKEGKVGIQTIAVEEDAARKVEEGKNETVYNLDRLGFPLIEISTAPDIKSPEQAERVALEIGQLLRMTGKVKRGLGTIRQDLNVSIMGGTKVEIKGVQRLELISTIIENEVRRQKTLLDIRQELKSRGVTEDMIKEIQQVDLTNVFLNTSSKIVRNGMSRGKVIGMRLPRMSGIMGRDVMPGRRFGTEVADYVRVLAGLGGLFHSDELPNYGITLDEVSEVKRVLDVKEGDGFVILVGEKEKLNIAVQTIKDRLNQALIGVPKETRGAEEDGTTRFLRPQPGSARMYPETDIPPMKVEDLMEQAKLYVPQPPEVKLKHFIEIGLNNELANQMLKSPRIDLFEYLTEKYNANPVFVATLLENTLKYVKSKGGDMNLVDEGVIETIVKHVSEGRISKDSVADILIEFTTSNKNLQDVISKYTSISTDQLISLIRQEVERNRKELVEKKDKAFTILMSTVMSKVRGKADGKVVAELIRKEIEKLQ
ncbi:Glu-tRNA(Gln) amidotransferase subunit GatE [Sulfuracidifex tepidarius]|nr:Glu-tRNA(Gln) amidotransferase subunit GatE [Sulfuracidifex tepidarius]